MPKRVFTETWLQGLLRKPPARRTFYSEAGRVGFQLRHETGGTLGWYLRYQRAGREAVLFLGNYPGTGLARAHKLHTDARELIEQGLDPVDERERIERVNEQQRIKERQTAGITVRNVIAEWGWHYARRERKRPREAVRLLRVNLKPWEGRPANELTRRDAVLLLDRIKARAPVMSNRIHALGLQAFTFAVSRDLVPNNPFVGTARPGGQETSKDRSLNTDEIRTAWQALDATETEMSQTVRLALRLILTTAQRPGEVMGAAWAEFDLNSKTPTWRIPAERAKNGKPHEIPMSDLAIELLGELRALSKDRPHICPSVHSKLKRDEPLSERALSRALRNNHSADGKLFGLEVFTPHDLRRTAASNMTALGIQRLVVSKVLGHADTETTAIYDRHDYASEKRLALQTWADELRVITAGKERKVLALRKAAK